MNPYVVYEPFRVHFVLKDLGYPRMEPEKRRLPIDESQARSLLTANRASLVTFPEPPRYLLYRALRALVPYIVGTWAVRVL